MHTKYIYKGDIALDQSQVAVGAVDIKQSFMQEVDFEPKVGLDFIRKDMENAKTNTHRIKSPGHIQCLADHVSLC